LPDNNSTDLIAAPLCLKCRELPQMMRMGRSLKVLKRMWSTNGKTVMFHFNVSQRHHAR
jgi:hypothetical protein